MWLVFMFAGLLHSISPYEIDLKKIEGLARGKVETCGGWQLNRLREVKAFVTQDIPLYHNLVMKHLPGADPELVLLNHYYEELDRILLNDMTRKEINELLVSLGFYKKADPDDPVPYEFRYAPAKDSPWDKQEPDPATTEQNQGADREPTGEPLETEPESQSPETQQHDPQAKHADL